MELELFINGEARRFTTPAGTSLTLAALLAQLDLLGKRIAVEVNGDIVPRSRHAEHPLAAGDRLEIVVAVGGG